jgi:hypothetical protein
MALQPQTKQALKVIGWIVGVIVAIILIYLFRVDLGLATADPVETAVKVESNEVTSLKIALSDKNGVIADKDKTIASLNTALANSKKPVTIKVNQQPCPPEKQLQPVVPNKTAEVVKSVAPAAAKNVQVEKVDPSPNIYSSAAVQDILCNKDGAVDFCLYLDNTVFWPHIAMINGVSVTEAVKNFQDTGYNIRITKYSESISGDYGAIKDPKTGLVITLYVKADLLQPYSLIYMRNNMRSWADQPTVKEGNYYVWHRPK